MRYWKVETADCAATNTTYETYKAVCEEIWLASNQVTRSRELARPVARVVRIRTELIAQRKLRIDVVGDRGTRGRSTTSHARRRDGLEEPADAEEHKPKQDNTGDEGSGTLGGRVART